MKKFKVLFFFFLLLSAFGHAQTNNLLLKKANRAYEKMSFANAIPLYKSYIQKGGKDTTAFVLLGLSYAKLNQYDSAIIYLEKVGHLSLSFQKVLAELYATKGDYVRAKQVYLQIKSAQQTLLTDARLYGFDHVTDFLADSLDYQIHSLPLNTSFNEFAAIPFNGGLVFESNRQVGLGKKIAKNKVAAWDGKPYTRLYTNNGRDSVVKLFTDAFKAKLNVGAISFTKDGHTAYYTRNASKKNKKGIYQLEIWESKFKEGAWTNGYKMFFNNSNFSYFHPFITPDGNRLYYVSDDSTGKGGTDIYFIDKNQDGSWKSTQNAGADINTQGNELYPTFYANTLFFSSNGHPGLGALDVFKVVKSKLRADDWDVQNLGYPINSSKDDITFSLLDSMGYFSSNRGGDDDVYAFDYKKTYIDVQGKIVTDSIVSHSNVLYYSYRSTNGNVLIDSVLIDANGNYNFKARANKQYQLYVVDDLGAKHPFEISTSKFVKINGQVQQNNNAFVVAPLEDQVQLLKAKQAASRAADMAVMTKQFKRAIDSLGAMTKEVYVLHHPFDQVYVVKEDLEIYYSLISKIKLLKNKKIVIVSATDCVGDEQYNEILSERRAARIYKTLSSLSNNEVVMKSVGETELINDCTDQKLQNINRYSYVFIVNK